MAAAQDVKVPLWQLQACELQRRYRDGSLTPLAVAEACLERLEAVNPRLNAVVARRDERFLAEAAAATQRHAQGRPLSVLDGVPLTVKDSLLTQDLPTTWGTASRRTQKEIVIAFWKFIAIILATDITSALEENLYALLA